MRAKLLRPKTAASKKPVMTYRVVYRDRQPPHGESALMIEATSEANARREALQLLDGMYIGGRRSCKIIYVEALTPEAKQERLDRWS